MNTALFSSARHDWRTPEPELDLVREVGPIRCDPCTHWLNPTKAQTFYARSPVPLSNGWLGSCGLTGPWPDDGLTWIQPPYGRFLYGLVRPDRDVFKTDQKTGERLFLGRGTGWATRIVQHRGPAIVLVPSRTDTDWWQRLWRWSDMVCFYKRRITFLDGETGEPAKAGATFPVSFFISGGTFGRIEPGFDRQEERDRKYYYVDRFARVFRNVGELAVKP